MSMNEEEEQFKAIAGEVFYGRSRSLVATLYITVSVFSLALQLLFIVGAKRLCGWQSNFSYTILLLISVNASITYVIQIINCILSLLYLDFEKTEQTWITLGALAWAPFFVIVVLNIMLTLHRLTWTLFPFTCIDYMTSKVLFCFLLIPLVVFIAFVVAAHTSILGIYWIAESMIYATVTERSTGFFNFLNTTSNYLIGVTNIVCYSIMLSYLYMKGALTLRCREVRMTVQICIMALCELLFFVYWQFGFEGKLSGGGIILAVLVNLLYMDVLIIPYLLLNGNVRREIKRCYHTYYRRSSSVKVIPVKF